MSKYIPLLILGCQRSGTTLLASMLGRHSDINMLFESKSAEIFNLIGKKYQGNKLLTWRQIRFRQKSSKWGHLINRLVNLNLGVKLKHHKRRPYPNAQLSINNYLEKGSKIVLITRDRNEVLKSILTRTSMNKKQAEFEIDQSELILKSIGRFGLQVTFKELVQTPAETMQKICSFLQLEYEDRMLQGSEFNPVYPNKIIDSNKSMK